MFDGFTKSKFFTKCKSSIKMTKTRLDALKKKKNAVIKFLKNDMADLLKNGLDYNAYNRAEGLIVEQNMIACYNFIEQFCGCIATNISVMNKQRECPEECRAAVQSLVYAAARFSEFPELRDLRTLFTERYGCLDPYINKQFVGLLTPQPATKEMKLQSMHDIAHEFSIEWSSKSLEQKLFKPPEPQHDYSGHEPLNNTGEDGYNVKKSKVDAVEEKNSEDDHNDQYIPKGNKNNYFPKRDGSDSSYKLDDLREDILRRRNEREQASHGRKPSFDRLKIQTSNEDEVSSFCRSEEGIDRDTVQAGSSSAAGASGENVDSKKPFYYRFIPPPYLKPSVEKEESKPVEQTDDPDDSSDDAKPKPRSVRRKPLKLPPGPENIGGIDSPLKPPPGREKVDSERKKTPGINPSALEKYGAKWGSRMSQTDDDNDSDKEEENDKILDGLLMHYSKRESPYKLNNDQRHLKPASQRSKSEVPPPPGRAINRSEPLTPNEECSVKRHVRAASAAPEMLSGCSVHPNLPDYDELAARIAALKGK